LIPQHFDILLLSLLGDLTLVGIYKFAKRLVEPINYIVTGFNPWIQNQYSNRKKIDFSDFVKKLLLPLSTVILLIFITTGKKIIELIGSNEFASAYEPMIILTFGYLIYLLTFWIRQALLFNELIIYHAYGRLIYSFVFIILSIPLTYFFNVAGLAYSLSSAIALQKIFEYIVYKKKIISE
jgi:O-antigen/teichoic acid export membrane protein